ncbi:hypothetical protein TSTA_000360 [Talaromyces stipitatus ATCC 10500]|uniref:Integrase catalytic domain-containing protein n=1 Tax=Talaromyces stipitatus (strain ATCC 10500 / CBS 375.48 / QM 6759 / NRRL 1006) TaxID=441959 RepID=B8MSG3_TALSN|nr:uncharacterized protein TSTA_000360 [Talaromyces stipitatus ATCC 10500]EED11958.1 hypothetical protein TSTA_000360 [Talaromyces stipitatus ATCC 10500]
MNQQAPRRFKFTLTDDQEFNFKIVVDVMYLDGEPVLHVVDSATSFQAAKFLKSLTVSKDVVLQMAVKAINNMAGPDRIMPTILVFGAYPCLTLDSLPSALTIRRAQAMKKAITELRKAVAERKVNDALNTRNGPIITETLNLPLGANIKVWREGKGWTGLHKLISVNGHDITVNLSNSAVAFRATSVQQYLQDQRETDNRIHVPEPPVTPPPPRRQGRPRESKNKQKADVNVYLSKKEKGDLKLALKLR